MVVECPPSAFRSLALLVFSFLIPCSCQLIYLLLFVNRPCLGISVGKVLNLFTGDFTLEFIFYQNVGDHAGHGETPVLLPLMAGTAGKYLSSLNRSLNSRGTNLINMP